MNTDAGIDYGDQVMLAEIVTTQVTVPTRQNADVTAFSKDIEKFFLHKAEQLDVTAANLLSDPQPANSPLSAPARRILPVAIRGGQFPLNPVTRRHIEDALQQKGLLHYRSGAPITRIALLDLEELELYESRGLTLPQLIAQWQACDGYADSSLHSFLDDAFPEGLRPAR